MTTSIPITVIVTVLNESTSITALLTALLNQSYELAEVIVVDGGSSDDTVAKIKQFQADHITFPLLYLTKVGNRSVGRNAAIQKAKTEVIAITDAGCVPHIDWVEELVKTYLESGTPVVAGYYDASPQTPFEAAVIPYVLVMPDRVNPKTFLPATRSMLLEKDVWSRLGGFNEKLNDNEDYAFAQLLKKQHVPITFASDAKVTWKPRSSLLSFAKMVWRFAKGDTYAGIWRPKVLAIFARYIFAVILLIYLILINQSILALNLFIIGLILYSYWAIRKNIRYAKNSWYWLPILQIVSDKAVMIGSLQGTINYFLK